MSWFRLTTRHPTFPSTHGSTSGGYEGRDVMLMAAAHVEAPSEGPSSRTPRSRRAWDNNAARISTVEGEEEKRRERERAECSVVWKFEWNDGKTWRTSTEFEKWVMRKRTRAQAYHRLLEDVHVKTASDLSWKKNSSHWGGVCKMSVCTQSLDGHVPIQDRIAPLAYIYIYICVCVLVCVYIYIYVYRIKI